MRIMYLIGGPVSTPRPDSRHRHCEQCSSSPATPDEPDVFAGYSLDRHASFTEATGDRPLPFVKKPVRVSVSIDLGSTAL